MQQQRHSLTHNVPDLDSVATKERKSEKWRKPTCIFLSPTKFPNFFAIAILAYPFLALPCFPSLALVARRSSRTDVPSQSDPSEPNPFLVLFEAYNSSSFRSCQESDAKYSRSWSEPGPRASWGTVSVQPEVAHRPQRICCWRRTVT